MRVSEALAAEPGVIRAAAVMATPLNVQLLAADGLLDGKLEAGPDDLLLAVLGADGPATQAALARADELLHVRRLTATTLETSPPRTVEAAAGSSLSNVAVIGVPGPAAAAEAFAALRSGLHVFLFSDNVPVEDEVRLKTLAADQNLLMMGPDCGTAMIGGVGLGFANRVQPGPVGIVGASGTGIQQLCCLLDAAGVGVAHAIGTGGRDLSAAVAGSMTRRSLRILEADTEVKVIAVISKPADGRRTAQRLHREMAKRSKPVVACLLGGTGATEGSVQYAGTLKESAELLVSLLGGDASAWKRAPTRTARRRSRDGRVHGLFAGGTLCEEARQVLDGLGVGHHLVDLGADQYTRGRAHPMIDPRLRASMLADLADHDDVGAVLLDVILGDLAHPDPAGALLPALETFQTTSPAPVVAALVGARRDPQGLDAQRQKLEKAGVHVFAANVDAAMAAGVAVKPWD
jgi:FdrA protein